MHTSWTWLGTTLLVAGAITMFINESGSSAAEKKDDTKLLRHVVLFQFKDDVTKEQAQEVADAFAALPKKIKEIVDFEWGTDVSVEKLSGGLTHGFLVTFKSEKDRDAYLPHAEHLKFVDLVKPRVEKVVVFDYWAKK